MREFSCSIGWPPQGRRMARTVAVACAFVAASHLHAGTFPDAHNPPTPGWNGTVFKLSQDYPTQLPAAGTLPWDNIDFKTQPMQYLLAVRDYVYEGNIDVDWQVQNNAVRKWFHAPWMHPGPAGREFARGLTRERPSQAGELHPNQTTEFPNWAVGVYNAPGGFTLGQVWADPNKPKPDAALFPVGTVSAKLLFTTATVAEVPYLRNAVRWRAHVTGPGSGTRAIRTVRLLQMDIAVRDSRADSTTGWVFGTFVYDGNAPGATPWQRMVPLGLMWGNDPTVTPTQGTLQETKINPNVNTPQHLGWAKRLNGPVDNKRSSCLSCHSTAQFPEFSDFLPPATGSDQTKLRWFRNIKAGEPFEVGAKSLDYSLQLSVGIRNFEDAHPNVTLGARMAPERKIFRASRGAGRR